MARISKEKKEENRKKILSVSKDLFFSKGYEQTSTSEIAKAVGIAEGTIFNYFKTKAEIFLSVITVDYITVTTEEFQSLDVSSGVVEVFMEFIEKSTKKMLIFPKSILIEILLAMINTAKTRPGLIKKMADIDFKFMDQTVELIEKMQKSGLIKPCSPVILSETIYSALMYEFSMYVYEKDRTLDCMKANLREKIEFIFNGYIA